MLQCCCHVIVPGIAASLLYRHQVHTVTEQPTSFFVSHLYNNNNNNNNNYNNYYYYNYYNYNNYNNYYNNNYY